MKAGYVIQSHPPQLHEFSHHWLHETRLQKNGCDELNSKSQLLANQQPLTIRENGLLGLVYLTLSLDSLDTGNACLAFCLYIKSTKW